MGNLKAKVGHDNSDFEKVIGKHGVRIMSSSGERLVKTCAINNMVIVGTLFKHHDIHKLTWNSPNGTDENQIDHWMINSMLKRSLEDVTIT